jgi:hypothetical protein
VPSAGRHGSFAGIVGKIDARLCAFALAHARALLCGLAALPYLPGAWLMLRGGIPDVLFPGDGATLELRLLDAAHGQLQLGAYSRFLWSHPGPAYFYLALPFYELLHQRGTALNLFVFLSSLTCAIASVLTARKLRGDFFAGAVAVLLGVYETLGVPFAMSSEWNPSVPLFPFVLMFFLAARLALGAGGGGGSSGRDGRSRRQASAVALPAFAFVGSAVVQTHLGYLPEVVLLSAAALLWSTGRWLWPRDRARVAPASEKRSAVAWSLIATAGVLAVCWALPVAEQMTARSGNLGRLFLFFTTPRAHEHTWSVATVQVFSQMAVMPLAIARALRLVEAGAPSSAVVMWLAGSQCLVVIAALVAGIRRRDVGLAVMATLAAGEILAAIGAVHAIRGGIYPYLVFWTSTVGFLSWVVAAAWLSRSPRQGPVARGVAMGLAIVGTLGLGGAVAGAFGHVQLFHEREVAVEKLAHAVESYLVSTTDRGGAGSGAGSGAGMRPIVRIVSPDTWPAALAVVLHLRKKAIPVAVEENWLYMVGRSFAAQGDTAYALTFGDAAFHNASRSRRDLELVAASQKETGGIVDKIGEKNVESIYVYREDRRYLRDHRVVGDPASVSARGVVGDPRRVADSVIPEEGSLWDSPVTVVLSAPTSSIEVPVPPGDVVGAFLSADGNDVYAVKCIGADGLSWLLGPRRREEAEAGMRTHMLFSDSLASCHAIEVTPLSGDGAYSVGEVGFLRR